MDGPMVHAVDIAADAATVYRAITTQTGEAAFWTSDCDVEPVVGSIARFGFPKAPVDLRMRVDRLDTDRLVSWACLGDFPYWAGTTIRWDLGPATTLQGTSVRFRQEGWPTDYPDLEYAQVNYTWGRIVGALKAYAESGSPRTVPGMKRACVDHRTVVVRRAGQRGALCRKRERASRRLA